MSKPIVVLDEKGNPPATPRSNLEKELLGMGNITPGTESNDTVQQMANFLLSDIKLTNPQQRPTVTAAPPNMMVRTNPPPNTTPKPITPNVPASLPTKVMTSANPPVRILPGNTTGISPTFKFAAPITGTVPTAPTGPTMITPGTTITLSGTPGANTVITTLPNAGQQAVDPQQRLAAFKLFLEKQKAIMGPAEGVQWVEIVNQYFGQKIDLRKLFDSLQVLAGKEKRDMVVAQATKEGHIAVPKPPQAAPPQPIGIPYIPTDKNVLNLLQPQQRDKILEQLKDYPEPQKYQIIARILEGNLRKKQQAAATAPAPTQIKPPTLPGQMSELDKKKLTTPAKAGDTAAKQALPEDVVEDLKDVTRVAGVDLERECEDILQDPEQTERWEEDRNPTVARTDVLKRRILEIANKNGVKSVTDDAVLYLAYAIEAQMRDVIGVANRGIPLTKMEMYAKKYAKNLLKNTSRKLRFIEKAEQEELKRFKKRKTDVDKHENMNRSSSVATNAILSVMNKNAPTAPAPATTTAAPAPPQPEKIVERTIVHDNPPPPPKKSNSSNSTILSFDD